MLHFHQNQFMFKNMPIETKRYMILFEGNEYPIIMPNIYSTEKFEKEFTYSGSDLGATYTPENS